MGNFILNSPNFSNLHTTNIIGSTLDASRLNFEMFCEYSPGAPLGFMWLRCLKAIISFQILLKIRGIRLAYKSFFLCLFVSNDSANSYDVDTYEAYEILVPILMQGLNFRSRFKLQENRMDIFIQSKLVCQFIS